MDVFVSSTILSLATRLGTMLQAKAALVTTAESCTGGGIAEAITRVPGSSAWFECGFVTYSNSAKIQLLGVDPELMKTVGAVSDAVVRAMAAGAMLRARSDYAVAVSGIAGPGGGSPAKPVGTVCLAWLSRSAVRAERLRFAGDRDAVRQQSVHTALEGLIRLMEDESSKV